jgi:hypothetical protein
VCAKNIVISEGVGIPKAQVNMGLGSKMEDGINLVTLEAVHDFRRIGDIAMIKAEVPFVIECPRVVQRGAIVELVKRDNVVGIRICHSQVSYQPAGTVYGRESVFNFFVVRVQSQTKGSLHEASTACDHDILDIG